MPIWKQPVTVAELNAGLDSTKQKTIHDALGIQFVAIGDDYLEATLPVDDRTKNPVGILHGGASVVLAESLGSIAAVLVAGPKDFICVGIEINASHLSSMSEGEVIGRATPIRLGKNLHVWSIEIRDRKDTSRLICQSRLTVMIKNRKELA